MAITIENVSDLEFIESDWKEIAELDMDITCNAVEITITSPCKLLISASEWGYIYKSTKYNTGESHEID